MRVFALSDLHLSFSVNKPMDIFGPQWENHAEKIETAWQETVSEEDLVLIPGDISWAMHLQDAQEDLTFVGRLKGTKVMIRGNHEYWWDSIGKVRRILPESVYAIQNDAFHMGNISVAGTRLWDLEDARTTPEGKKVYERELMRLKMSLDQLDTSKECLVMVHYPPFDDGHTKTGAKELLEQYPVKQVLYGHLHGKAHMTAFNGEKNGIWYRLTSADYLDFKPIQIL